MARRPSASRAIAKSSAWWMALVQTGSYSAASSNPTTAALIPLSAPPKLLQLRSRSQKGAAPITRRKEGRNIAPRANSPPDHPDGAFATSSEVPRYAEKVNSGPGTACAAPYPAMNSELVTHPRCYDQFLEQRQDDMASAEHQGTCPEEAVEDLQGFGKRARTHRSMERRRPHENYRQQHQARHRQSPAHAELLLTTIFGLLGLEEGPANDPGGSDHQQLPPARRPGQDAHRRRNCDRCSGTIGTETSCHPPDGQRHDRHGGSLQSAKPAGAFQVAELGYSVGEKDQQRRRWSGEAQPGGQSSGQAGPPDSQRNANLAAGRARQELAEGDQVPRRPLRPANLDAPRFLGGSNPDERRGPPKEVRPSRRKTMNTSSTAEGPECRLGSTVTKGPLHPASQAADPPPHQRVRADSDHRTRHHAVHPPSPNS